MKRKAAERDRVLEAAWIFLAVIVFGLVIAAIGCQRGLETGAGAASVGRSATSTVVTSIVWIVVLDGLFSVLIARWNI